MRRISFSRSNKKLFILVMVSAILIVGAFGIRMGTGKHSVAACSALPTDRGSGTQTINVPTAGTYRFWARMQASSSANNSFTLQVDDTICNVTVGDNSAISTSALGWVDYQSGTTTNKINLTLSAGSHTFLVQGKEDAVIVDRFLLTTDTSCVPTGLGDNCAIVADTTPPTVSITAPANSATVSNTVTVTATASDNDAVSKVEFFVDNTKIGEDATSPYSLAWNSTTVANGAHTIVALATDASGNTKSAQVSVTVSNTVARKPGDANNDGKVDVFDLSILLTNYGKPGTINQGDFNNDAKIDIFDLSILLANYGT